MVSTGINSSELSVKQEAIFLIFFLILLLANIQIKNMATPQIIASHWLSNNRPIFYIHY
jgi:hypothetical protein